VHKSSSLLIFDRDQPYLQQILMFRMADPARSLNVV
jgi:hypothetical protein